MDEEAARVVLGKLVQSDGSLYGLNDFVYWNKDGMEEIILDGRFNAVQLLALSWWLDNKPLPRKTS